MDVLYPRSSLALRTSLSYVPLTNGNMDLQALNSFPLFDKYISSLKQQGVSNSLLDKLKDTLDGTFHVWSRARTLCDGIQG